MRYGWRALVAGWVLGLASTAGYGASSRLTQAQEQRLTALFRQSERLEQAGDVVRAYAALREATRLEQLWTSNMAGDDALATKRLNRFILGVIRRDDTSVQRILHSKQIALGDKLSLIHVLEQDILVNYPGSMAAGLLGGDE